jgi:hypothetical protein
VTPREAQPARACRGDLAGAELVVSEDAARAFPRDRLVDAAVVAAYLSVDRAYVYENAARLGARRLGDGPRARLRFSLDDVDAATSCLTGRGSSSAQSGTVEPKPTRRRRRGLGTEEPLVPMRARRTA